MANQIIVALNIEAVGEALLFAAKAGADPAKVRQALMGGFASSRILEVHGERMIKRTFDPGFRIELHQKDLNLALSSARALGVSLPNTATAQELFNCLRRPRRHRPGTTRRMVRALEMMANFEIGQKACLNIPETPETRNASRCVIRMHANDNVAIVVNDGGLPAGAVAAGRPRRCASTCRRGTRSR